MDNLDVDKAEDDNPISKSEQQIEENVRSNRFLRVNDSEESQSSHSSAEEEEEVEIESKRNSSNGKDSKESNECQNNQTLSVTSLTKTGDKFCKTDKTQTQSKPTNSLKADEIQILFKRKGFKNGDTKWGQLVGIYDANGNPKRFVRLNEMKNYLHLRPKVETEFKFYFSLINWRYPQLYKRLDSHQQRWRMRYNVFVDGLFASSSSSHRSDSVLHVGEIHMYFDVSNYMSRPYYQNCSFYGNYQPFNREVMSSRLQDLIFELNSVLTSNDLLQLKFPIPKRAFNNCDQLYYDFSQLQSLIMSESAFFNLNRLSIPYGKRFTIDSQPKHEDSDRNYDRFVPNERSFTHRNGDQIRNYKTRRNNTEVNRYELDSGPNYQNRRSNYRPEGQPIQRFEDKRPKIWSFDRFCGRELSPKSDNRYHNYRSREGLSVSPIRGNSDSNFRSGRKSERRSRSRAKPYF
jgi:hypothetical protein